MDDHCFTLLRYPTYIDFTSDCQFHMSGQIKKCYFKSRLSPFNQAVYCVKQQRVCDEFPKTTSLLKFGGFQFVHSYVQGC